MAAAAELVAVAAGGGFIGSKAATITAGLDEFGLVRVGETSFHTSQQTI